MNNSLLMRRFKGFSDLLGDRKRFVERNRTLGNAISKSHSFDQFEDERPHSIGFLEPEWNSFDKLAPETRILHTTKRRTQPWKTGLPVDYTLRETGPLDFLRRMWSQRYQQHPDRNQEGFIYSLLAEMVDEGAVTKDELVREMAANHIRHDSLELVERYRGWELFEQAA